MPMEDFARLIEEGLFLAIYLSAPALLTALVLGVMVAVFSAATQVQDASLGYVPKLIGVVTALALAGSWMARELIGFTEQLWLVIPQLAQ